MKKIIVALLATGLMGSALAQSAPPANPPQAGTKAQAKVTPPPASVPGAKGATTQSLGEMTPFAVVGGLVVVGIIVAASSGGGGNKTASPPPTGTH
jgi:hypothetical protein